MSQGNVDIVRRVYAALNDRQLDTVVELVDPEFCAHATPDDPEQEPRHGIDTNLAFLEAQWRALPALRTEIEQAFDVGGDVVALVRHTARVPGSDAEIERREAHVWSLRDAKVISLHEFATREQALEAAGLSE